MSHVVIDKNIYIFVSVAFRFSGFQCVLVSSEGRLCLSYPVRRHGTAFTSPLTVIHRVVSVTSVALGWVIDRYFTPMAQNATHFHSTSSRTWVSDFEHFLNRNAYACIPENHVCLVPRVVKRSLQAHVRPYMVPLRPSSAIQRGG